MQHRGPRITMTVTCVTSTHDWQSVGGCLLLFPANFGESDLDAHRAASLGGHVHLMSNPAGAPLDPPRRCPAKPAVIVTQPRISG